jgi:hypothetical protein
MEDLQDKIIELMDLFDGEVTTADKIDRPQQALDREAYDDFMKRNPMAGGGRMGFYKGQLVTQGPNKGKYVIYNVPESVSKTKTKYFSNEKAMNKWIESQPGKGRKDFGKFVTGAQFKDTIRPQNLEKLEKLKQIIIESNSQYKKSLTSKAALEAAGFPGGYQAIATKGKLREEVKKEIAKLLTTQEKIDNYVNNVMFAEDALVKDFKNPLTHIAKKFGVSSGTLRNWAKNSQVYQDNKPIFVGLSRELNYNKYKFIGADNTPRLMSDYSVIMQNKLPSSASLIRGDSAEKFILQSAYRHFKQSKEAGKAAKVTFIGDPDLLPFNEWKFIKGGKLYSVDPAIDTLEFQGKTYTNNYLNRIDAKDIYKNDFGEIYKIFDDLETYMNSTTTVGNKDVKLDTILRKRLYDATGKKDYLLRRAVDIDHFSGILDEPFKNLRLLDRRSNQLAGIIKRQSKYKNNPKLLNKVLTDIGYTTPYKDIDTFVKRSIKNINTPVRNVEGIPINIKNIIASFGDGNCPVTFGKKKRDGGRIGYQTGTPGLNQCIESGIKNFKEGKFKTADQAQDAARLLGGGKNVLRAITKYGIVPEAAFVAGEAVFRNILGEKPLNAIKKSIDTFTFGLTNFTSGIEAAKFGKDADLKLSVDKFRASQNKVNSIEQDIANLETLNTGSQFGYEGDQTEAIQMKKMELEAAKKELEQNYVNPDMVQYIDRKGENIADAQMAKSSFAKASLKDQMDGIPGVTDYMDTETARVFPRQPSQAELNLNMLPSFKDYQKSDQGQIDRTILNAPDEVLKEISPDALNLKKGLQEAYKVENLKDTFGAEQIYGTQGVFSQPLAKGGRAGFKLGSVRKGVLSLIDESLKKTPKDTTTELDKLIKKTLDEDLFDKKDRIIDNINARIVKAKEKGLDSEEIGKGQIEFYDNIIKSNFRTKTGPFFDYQKRKNKAGGGLLKQAGDRSGPPPESGPNSQGLQGLMKRGMKI